MRVSEMAREYVPDDPVYFPIAARRTGPCCYCTDAIEKGDAIVRRDGDSRWCHLGCARLADEIAADPQGFLERELEQSKRWRQGAMS